MPSPESGEKYGFENEEIPTKQKYFKITSSFEEKFRFVYMSAICSHAQGYISEKTLLQKKRQ